MLVKIEIGGAESRRVGIYEAEDRQAAAELVRDEWGLPTGPEETNVRWETKPEGADYWPETAFFLYFEPDIYDSVEDAAEEEYAVWIHATEIKLGQFYDPIY